MGPEEPLDGNTPACHVQAPVGFPLRARGHCHQLQLQRRSRCPVPALVGPASSRRTRQPRHQEPKQIHGGRTQKNRSKEAQAQIQGH